MISCRSEKSDYTKPHKVLICSPSDWIRGGVQNYIYTTVSAIDKKEIQIDFYTPRKMPDDLYVEEMNILGVNMFAGNQEGNRPNYKKVYKDIKSLISNYHYTVIHINTGSPTFQASSLLAAWKPGKPVCCISHSHNAVNESILSINHKIIYALCRFVVTMLATHFLACSVLAGNFLFGKKIMAKRGRVINNGIDFEKYMFKKEIRIALRKKLRIDNDVLVLGLTAHFTQQKNHGFLIKIFNEVLRLNGNARLLLLGDDVNGISLRKDIEDFATRLGIKEKIFFLGAVVNTNEYYSAMDVFVMPSLWEGLPYAGVEAQAASLPCIFSDRISRELALTKNAQFISLDEGAEKWAKKIIEAALKSSVNTRVNISEQIRGDIKAHGFDLYESISYIEKLYLYRKETD